MGGSAGSDRAWGAGGKAGCKRKRRRLGGDSDSARTTNRGFGQLKWPTTVWVRRPNRVTCGVCRASHPAIYDGQACLICGSMIGAGEHPRNAGAVEVTMHKARNSKRDYQAKIAALRSERDELMAALESLRSSQGPVGTSDYEWHVELAAKGLAQRDKYPMPTGVTAQREFYEIMAGAALDAAGLRFLLERVERAERSLEAIQDAMRQADVRVENARHRSKTDAADPWTTVARGAPAATTAHVTSKPPSNARGSRETVIRRQRWLSRLYSTLSPGRHDRPRSARPPIPT